MTNPWDPFDTLREVVRTTVDTLGMDFLTWVIMPGGDPTTDERACQIAFEIRPDAFQDDQQRATQREFDAMMESEREIEVAEKLERDTETVKEKLIDITRHGIFPEEDDDEDG